MVEFRKIAIILALAALMTAILTLPIAAQVTSQNSIPNTLSQYTDFTTLNKALGAAGLGNYLSGKGPYTFFAPTNAAFNQFTPGTLNALFSDTQKIGDILQYHIVPGKLSISDLANTGSVKTIDGRTLPVSVQNGYLMVGGARVITTGISCSNGVIYPVDSLILPPATSAPGGKPVAGPAFTPQQYAPPQPTASQPVAQPPAPRGGPGLLKTIGITLGIILLGIILVGLFLLWLFIKFIKGIFRGPRPGRQPGPPSGYTAPPPSRPETGKDVYEPTTFGSTAPAGTPTIRDEGPYISGGTLAQEPIGTSVSTGTGGITFDESAVNELKQMDRSRLASIHQYIVGSYNNFKDMLDLVRDAHIDLKDIKDNNAVKRFMDRYHLSPFNSNTLELALERNATIYTKDSMLLEIYRAAGAKAEDLRRLLAGS
jgi:uncharacterized surface protein with fasciclin (FAS1) repeats